MIVKVETVEWIAPKIAEGTVTFCIGGASYQAFSCGPQYEAGAIIDADFTHLEGRTEWQERFTRDPEHKKCIVQTDRWSYDGFGQIVSVGPVVADFGVSHLSLGDWTHDGRVVGEFVFWRIARLDIHPREEPNKEIGCRPKSAPCLFQSPTSPSPDLHDRRQICK